MKFRDYSVRVLNSKDNPAEETSKGHVFLEHEETYSLLLRNFSRQDAIAKVSIDGKLVTYIKVPKEGKVQIDTTSESDKKFTFYKLAVEGDRDYDGDVAALLEDVSEEELGLIQVVFKPVSEDFHWKTVYLGTNTIYIPYYPVVWEKLSPVLVPNYPLYNTITVTESRPDRFTYCANTVSGSFGGSSSVGYTSSNILLNTTMAGGGTGMSGMAEHVPLRTEEAKKDFKHELDEEELVTIELRLAWKHSKKITLEKLKGVSTPRPAPIR